MEGQRSDLGDIQTDGEVAPLQIIEFETIGIENVEALQTDLDAWLHHYNHERPHLGYRNQGRKPWETVERFVSQEG